jgi:hypothetical protein
MSGRRCAIVYLTRKPDGAWTAVKTARTGIFPEVAVTNSPFTTLIGRKCVAAETCSRPKASVSR